MTYYMYFKISNTTFVILVYIKKDHVKINGFLSLVSYVSNQYLSLVLFILGSEAFIVKGDESDEVY